MIIPSNLPKLNIHDPNNIPRDFSHFKRCHFKALSRLRKHNINKTFDGLMSIEINMPLFTKVMMEIGYVYIADYIENLNMSTVSVLKEILKEHGYKVSGNKAEIINRIIGNIKEEDIISSSAYQEYYSISDEAEQAIDDFYNSNHPELQSYYGDVISLIWNKEYDMAYRMCCQHNAEETTARGLNCSWDKWYLQGIDEDYLYRTHIIFDSESDKLFASIVLFQYYSGELQEHIANIVIGWGLYSEDIKNFQQRLINYRKEINAMPHIWDLEKTGARYE